LITPQSYKWFFEPTTAVEGHMHAIRRTIVEARTKFQHVEIMETHPYGKVLVLDGRIQSSQAGGLHLTTRRSSTRHAASERAPETGLVIGGGEGATLREMLRYPPSAAPSWSTSTTRWSRSARSTLPEMHQGAFETPAPSSATRTPG